MACTTAGSLCDQNCRDHVHWSCARRLVPRGGLVVEALHTGAETSERYVQFEVDQSRLHLDVRSYTSSISSMPDEDQQKQAYQRLSLMLLSKSTAMIDLISLVTAGIPHVAESTYALTYLSAVSVGLQTLRSYSAVHSISSSTK